MKKALIEEGILFAISVVGERIIKTNSGKYYVLNSDKHISHDKKIGYSGKLMYCSDSMSGKYIFE